MKVKQRPDRYVAERTNDGDGIAITLEFTGIPTRNTYVYLKELCEFKINQFDILAAKGKSS